MVRATWIPEEDVILRANYVGKKTTNDVLAALQAEGYKGKTLEQVRNRIKSLKLSKVVRGKNLPHATTVLLVTRAIDQRANDKANNIIRTWLAYLPSQMDKSNWRKYGTMVNNGTWDTWKQTTQQLSMTTEAVRSRSRRQLYGKGGSAQAVAREASVVGAPPALPPLPIVGDDEIAAARASAAEAVAASGMEDLSF